MAQSQSAMTDPSCNACTGTWPRQDHFIADLGLSKVYLHDDQFFSGWTVVVFQRHATELFELAPAERFQLIEEVNRVAEISAKVHQARKMNYELLGNQLPHIHWHIIPRLVGDPAPLEPVWRVPHSSLLLTGAALHEAINRLAHPLRLAGGDKPVRPASPAQMI